MKNFWVDEINTRKIVEILNQELQMKFIGTCHNVHEINSFFIFVLDYYDSPKRIRDAITWKYNLVFEYNQNNEITKIELNKLSWFK